ncbi:MAG: outer membrane lipoprotein carrier protein LolA [Planctomycetota bacterium]
MIRAVAVILASLWACAGGGPGGETDPWGWWDSGASQELSLRTSFDFEKKSRTRRKPIKLQGDFLFRRKGQESTLLLHFSKATDKGPELDSTVLIDAHRWWTLTPGRDGGRATLEKVDLDRQKGIRGAVHALAFLHGRSRKELEQDFIAEVVTPPDDTGQWSFRLVPKSEDNRRHVLAVTVTLSRERMTSLRIELPREEWAHFDFKTLDHTDVKDHDLALVIPDDADIVEDEAVEDSQ